MEVRVIDPKNPNETHHAGKVLGTVIRLVPLSRHHPAPNPYRFLIDRALNQNAGDAGPKLTHESSANSSHETDRIFPSPPATSQEPYFLTKDDSGNEVWWNPSAKTFESRGHHNAGRTRTAFGKTEHLLESQSAPSSPAPNHQNAEATEVTNPLLAQLQVMCKISSTSARPAPKSSPHSDKAEAIGIQVSPRSRGLRHILSKLIDKIVEHSSFNDPSMEMTNFGWRKKA